MANYKTGAQRYNDRMDKIFARSKELNEKYHGKDSFGSRGNSGMKGHGVNSPAMTEARKGFAKAKALKNAKESKKEYTKRHGADLLKYETN